MRGVENINTYIGKREHILFIKYCSTYTFKIFPAHKTDSPLVFAYTSRFIKLSSWHRRVTSTYSLNENAFLSINYYKNKNISLIIQILYTALCVVV